MVAFTVDAQHGQVGADGTSNIGRRDFLKATAAGLTFALTLAADPSSITGEQARRVLLDAVAARWSVPVGELSTEPSVVVHAASGRRIRYGDIADFAKAPPELPRIEDKQLKSPASFRYIGKDLPRVDVA